MSGGRQTDRQAGRAHKQDVLPGAPRGPRDIRISAEPRPQACIRKQQYEELHLLRPQKMPAGQEDVHVRFRRQAKWMTLVINYVIVSFPHSLSCQETPNIYNPLTIHTADPN